MMQVYDLRTDNNGEWISFSAVNSLRFPQSQQETEAFFAHQEVIQLVRDNKGVRKSDKQKLPDYASVDYEFCFSGRAKAIFEPYLFGFGQWRQMDFEGLPYWLLNITNVVDALDETASKVVSMGTVVEIHQFVFRPERLRGVFLFKIPQRPSLYLLATDSFVDIVREHQLTGFMFRLVWSSDSGPVPYDLKDWEKPRITGREPQLAR
jgi:hypothetical protein